jgi:hypothetical protein
VARDVSEIHNDEFDALKDAIWEKGKDGPFTVAEILFSAWRAGARVEPDEIEPMLEYLVGAGHLFRIDDDPPRWRWPGGPDKKPGSDSN